MILYFRNLIFSAFLFVLCGNLMASHVPGGNITYEYVGPNTWVITLTVFEDCGNSFMTNAAEQITATNTCGLNSPNISLPNVIFQDEVSQLCPLILNQGQSECNGGAFPGVYMHVWQDTITLPGPCDSWVFSYDDCCRNQSVNLVGISNDYYFETVLNSVTAPANSSPIITSQPIPYNCINQPVNYNFGVIEPDGDSLHFSLVDALEQPGVSAPYAAGYTGPSPINGIAINPNTGEITFTPTIQGNFVVVVLIEEFNSNGDLVGSIMQDFQFEIIACTNIGPSPPVGGIINFYGNGILTGPFDIQACDGDSICFDMEFTDANPTDSLFVNSNITQLFPGSTVTQNGFFSPVTASFCMVVLPGTNPFTTISVTVNDNACPTVGTTSSAIGLTVISSTYAGPDVTMCQGVPTLLNSSGGSNFNWSVISGDPISLGNNFSCNGCSNPVINPAYSTVYKVVSNLSGGCSNTDTISVDVVPDFNYSLTQSATTTCLNSSIQFNVSPSPIGNYSYQWSPATSLTNSNTATPEFNSSIPGLYEYELTIVSNLGCVKVDTLSVNVLPAYSPDITLTASDTNVFCGDTVYLDAGLGGGVPAFCGPSGATTCNAPTSSQSIGTDMGSNSGTQYPSPFGFYYESVKEQYLFRAAELIASGFAGGKITEIAWDAIAQNNAAAIFPNYTIKMGCTNQNTLNTWQGGLTTVFSPQNVTIAIGVNQFVLTTAYEWDGISNLVVEVCFDNTANNAYTNNWSVPHQIFPYNTSLNIKSDLNNVCPSLTAPLADNKRPVTTFKTCPTIPDPNNFSFQWTPPSFLSSMSDQSPYSIPFVSTYYNVVVTDLNGGCTDTASIFINVLCDTCDKPLPSINGITCFGGSDASITAMPGGTDGPPWIIQLLDGFSNNTFGIDSNVTDSVVFNNLSAGNYVLRSLDTTGCYADTAITIPDIDPLLALLSIDTTICTGGTALISSSVSGGTSPYIYNWNNGFSGSGPHSVSPIASQYYSLTVEDSLNCTSEIDSVLVLVNPSLSINFTPPDSICPGDSVNLNASGLGGDSGPYNFSWSYTNGSNFSNQSTAYTTPLRNNTYYYLTLTDNCETPSEKDSILISWFDLPVVNFSSDITSGCWPVKINFQNNTNLSQVFSCQWDLGNTINSTNLDTVSTFYNTPGSYDVSLEVTNSNGCKNEISYSDYIEVYDYPLAGFVSTPNPVSILSPRVQFLDTSSLDVISFNWTFYDSTNTIIGTDTNQNPTFDFDGTIEQQYNVKLYIENQNGCSDSTFGTLYVKAEYVFYMPNSFTPNGDGLNDVFFPVGDKISVDSYSFKIFNRWGELVFQTDLFGEDDGWDGTFINKEAPSDSYIWRVDLIDSSSGEEKSFQGYVLLTR